MSVLQKCTFCNKPVVYHTEEQRIDGKLFHKQCVDLKGSPAHSTSNNNPTSPKHTPSTPSTHTPTPNHNPTSPKQVPSTPSTHTPTPNHNLTSPKHTPSTPSTHTPTPNHNPTSPKHTPSTPSTHTPTPNHNPTSPKHTSSTPSTHTPTPNHNLTSPKHTPTTTSTHTPTPNNNLTSPKHTPSTPSTHTPTPNNNLTSPKHTPTTPSTHTPTHNNNLTSPKHTPSTPSTHTPTPNHNLTSPKHAPSTPSTHTPTPNNNPTSPKPMPSTHTPTPNNNLTSPKHTLSTPSTHTPTPNNNLTSPKHTPTTPSTHTPTPNHNLTSPKHASSTPSTHTPTSNNNPTSPIHAPPSRGRLDIMKTNLSFFGSSGEREIKKFAAEGEPAWKTAGKVPGIQIWRVEKFQIKEWPRDKYGHFFDGDSYIVLHSYGRIESLLYHVHFWLGHYTTQDEAGTAAYKTVELDDYLGGRPVQYREVQGSESQTFLNLFDKIIIQHGGIESGFRHVEAEKYRPRLLHIKGTTHKTVVREVPLSSKSLNSGDVFILDEGLKLFQFSGKDASAAEKDKAMKIVRGIDDERKSRVQIFVLEELKEGMAKEREKAGWEHFWMRLGGKIPISANDSESDNKVIDIKEIFKISDATGKLAFTHVPFEKSSLQEDDAFVVSTGSMVFVWIGKRANTLERKSAFTFAQKYLNDHPDLPKTIPIVRILSGGENDEFYSYF